MTRSPSGTHASDGADGWDRRSQRTVISQQLPNISAAISMERSTLEQRRRAWLGGPTSVHAQYLQEIEARGVSYVSGIRTPIILEQCFTSPTLVIALFYGSHSDSSHVGHMSPLEKVAYAIELVHRHCMQQPYQPWFNMPETASSFMDEEKLRNLPQQSCEDEIAAFAAFLLEIHATPQTISMPPSPLSQPAFSLSTSAPGPTSLP